MKTWMWIGVVAMIGCSPGTEWDDLPQAGPLDLQAPPPELSIDALLPGHPALITATANPGERVYFVKGDSLGAGICPAPMNGECVDVLNARLAGSARADATGIATLDYDVALGAAPGEPIAFQAIVLTPALSIGDAVETGISAPGDVCERTGLGVYPDADADAECDLLVLTNEIRALGVDCGNSGVRPPTHPLTMNDALREAARVHSDWQRTTGNFGHSSVGGPLGDTIGQRARQAGYLWKKVSENVARGRNKAAPVLDGWLNSSGHCRNVMNSEFVDVGYGRSQGANTSTYWTGVFGKPR